jgi:pilus assembly protein FimV
MRRKLAWLAAIACVAWLVPAWALSLGGIRVHSRLNQPLTASIPIYPAAGEVIDETIKVRLASNEDYARAGLERLDFLSDLSFAVEPDRIIVSSKRSVREPVVDLLVEVRWSSGRLLRQYTMLLDPEGIGAPPPPLEPSHQATAPTPETAGQAMSRAPSSPGNVGGTRVRPTSPAETPPLTYRPVPGPPGAVIPSNTPSSSKSLPRTYGPVRPNETPWSVATKLKPDETVTTEQVIIALFQWNPTAFGANLATFKPGSILRVPDLEVIRRVDPVIAKSRIEEARAKAAPPPVEAAAPKPAAPEVAPSTTATAPGAAAPKAETSPATPAPKAETAPGTPATSPAPAETAPATAEQPTTPPAEAAPQETPPPAPAPEHKKSGMDSWLIPAVIAAAVLFLIVLVWRFSRRPKSPGEDFAMDDSATLATPPSSRSAPSAPRPVMAEPEEEEEPAAMRAPAAPEPEIPQPPSRVSFPEPTPPAAAPAPAPAAAKPMAAPSFADTALTDTRQIDLEGGDALAEADFHLAYGLYDEAILLLTQALMRDPNRSDVRTKLAEAYFSANRGQEFLETARALKAQLDGAGWEKIAVLGRQLFPSDPLFGGSGKAQPAPAGETAAAPRPAGTIPFEASVAPAKPAAPPPAARPAAASIPFDMGSLDLDTPIQTPAAPAAGGASVDLDTGIGMDDGGMGGGDESSTKLDLARAYIDLGDHDMARGLLSEVIQQGTGEQKQAAEELMRKLPA